MTTHTVCRILIIVLVCPLAEAQRFPSCDYPPPHELEKLFSEK
jgi:hypothetical protein